MDAGRESLAEALAMEALACPQGTATKPYIAALCKVRHLLRHSDTRATLGLKTPSSWNFEFSAIYMLPMGYALLDCCNLDWIYLLPLMFPGSVICDAATCEHISRGYH